MLHVPPAIPADASGFQRLRLLPPFAWSRIDILVPSLCLNVLSLALPLVILQVYDRIIPNKTTDTLALLIIGLFFVLVLDGVIRMVRHYFTGWWAARFEHAVSCRAMGRLASANLASLEMDGPGTHLDRLSAIDSVRDFYSSQAVEAMVDLPFVFLFLALIGVIGGPLVAVPLASFALSAMTSVIVGRRLRTALWHRQENDNRRINFIIEVLAGIHTVKGMALEAPFIRRHERLQESSADAMYLATYYAAIAQNVGMLSSNLTMIAIASFGGLMVLHGELTVGMLAACILLSGRSIQPLLRAMGAWTQYQAIKIAETQVNHLLALPQEAAPCAPAMPELEGAVELQAVHFAYAAGHEPILNGIDIKVEPGATVVVLGDNGSGKSTLLRVIMGLLKPTAGRVLLDGADPAEHDPVSVRSQIAYIPQNGVLFRGTMLENITMFRGEEHLDRAMEIARWIGLDEVIARLPDGLKTRIGDSSSEILPRGLRQSIAIVGALATNPKLILFDEANNSLDVRTDERLKALLEDLRGGCTLVLVTHRPSLVTLADHIFVLTNGVLLNRESAPLSSLPLQNYDADDLRQSGNREYPGGGEIDFVWPIPSSKRISSL